MIHPKQQTVTAEGALPDRDKGIIPALPHAVNGELLVKQPPDGKEQILLALGCFWGAERLFWNIPGVVNTSVGYSGGYTKNPTYEDVCTARTGHTEVVQVIFDPAVIKLSELLKLFWQSHNPTQGMRQGNDVGTQYRSAIYFYNEDQQKQAEKSKALYQQALKDSGVTDGISTEILPAGEYFFAETYHQQYLHKNPQGYCGLGGTGVCMPPEAS